MEKVQGTQASRPPRENGEKENSPVIAFNISSFRTIAGIIKELGVVSVIALYLVWSLVAFGRGKLEEIARDTSDISRSMEAIAQTLDRLEKKTLSGEVRAEGFR